MHEIHASQIKLAMDPPGSCNLQGTLSVFMQLADCHYYPTTVAPFQLLPDSTLVCLFCFETNPILSHRFLFLSLCNHIDARVLHFLCMLPSADR